MNREEKMQKLLHGASAAGELAAVGSALSLAIQSFTVLGAKEELAKLLAMSDELSLIAINLIENTADLSTELTGGADEQASM